MMENDCSRAHFGMDDCIRSVTNEIYTTDYQEQLLSMLNRLWNQDLEKCYDKDVKNFVDTFDSIQSGLKRRYHDLILNCIEYGKSVGLMKNDICPSIIFGMIAMWQPLFGFGLCFVEQMSQACPEPMVVGFKDPFFKKLLGVMCIIANEGFMGMQRRRKRILKRNDIERFFTQASPCATENSGFLYLNVIVALIFMMEKASFPLYV